MAKLFVQKIDGHLGRDQGDLRGDATVNVHLVIDCSIRLGLDEDWWKRDGYRGGRLNRGSEQPKRSRMAHGAAIAPIFQITGRLTSRLVVPTNRNRPLRCSVATFSRISGVMYWSILARNGAVLESAVPLVTPEKRVGIRRSLVELVV